MAIVFYTNNTIQPQTNSFCGAVPTSVTQGWDLKDSHAPVSNDEARSCTLLDVTAGTIITVFDSPSASTGDDWTEIVVKQNIVSYTISSFEKNIDDAYVTQTFHKHNGLDGKISNIQIKAS